MKEYEAYAMPRKNIWISRPNLINQEQMCNTSKVTNQKMIKTMQLNENSNVYKLNRIREYAIKGHPVVIKI